MAGFNVSQKIVKGIKKRKATIKRLFEGSDPLVDFDFNEAKVLFNPWENFDSPNYLFEPRRVNYYEHLRDRTTPYFNPNEFVVSEQRPVIFGSEERLEELRAEAEETVTGESLSDLLYRVLSDQLAKDITSR